MEEKHIAAIFNFTILIWNMKEWNEQTQIYCHVEFTNSNGLYARIKLLMIDFPSGFFIFYEEHV